MSTNLFMFFVFVFIAGQLLSMFAEGRTGLATTTLTSNLSASATTMSVHSTSGFGSEDVVEIDGEVICYTGITATTFTGLTRGTDCRSSNDAAADHDSGSRVYSETPGVVNRLVGFNIAEAYSDGGIVGFIKGTWETTKNIPNFLQAVSSMLMWDYSYLEGTGVYIKYLLLYPLSAGLVLSFIRLALGR